MSNDIPMVMRSHRGSLWTRRLKSVLNRVDNGFTFGSRVATLSLIAVP
jgi:hypothetical protein